MHVLIWKIRVRIFDSSFWLLWFFMDCWWLVVLLDVHPGRQVYDRLQIVLFAIGVKVLTLCSLPIPSVTMKEEIAVKNNAICCGSCWNSASQQNQEGCYLTGIDTIVSPSHVFAWSNFYSFCSTIGTTKHLIAWNPQRIPFQSISLIWCFH